MGIPLQITFRDLEPTESISQVIRHRAEKLAELTDRITACEVVVEAPHRHHHKGHSYHVRILMTVPGGDVIVQRDPSDANHDDVYVALRDAFSAARRQLKDHLERQRNGG